MFAWPMRLHSKGFYRFRCGIFVIEIIECETTGFVNAILAYA